MLKDNIGLVESGVRSDSAGIVGDLYEVLPKFTNAVKEKMG